MILIIAEPADGAALWLEPRLARYSDRPVKIVTPARLVYARSIVHRLDTRGSDFRFEISGGETFAAAALSGVVNRILTFPVDHLAAAAPGEREYAAGELHAFLLGWLASLACPVLNRPAADCLAGPCHSEVVARHFAAVAGLTSDRACLTSASPWPPPPGPRFAAVRHFVLDGQVIGPPAAQSDAAALIRFAALWGARLLQIDTERAAGRTRLLNASAFADFSSGGPALVRAIARALGR